MHTTLLKNGMVYIGRRFMRKNLLLANGRITVLKPEAQVPADTVAEPEVKGPANTVAEPEVKGPADTVVDAQGLRIVPGFLDIHTHGAVGVDVNHASADDLEKICRFAAQNGTTSWLCSILTDTPRQTARCIDQFLLHQEKPGQGAELLGIHLEGPFLSPAYRGAMPEHLLRTADMPLLRSYQERARGNIRYITVSPEVEGVTEAIPETVSLGIRVAIGHSGADYETACRAIQNGAAAATHTGNAMKPLDRHEPGIFGAVLESDVYCEAICDGRHLHPGVVRLLLKTKGTDRVIAVTDSIMAAGLPDGQYQLGVNDVTVKNGDAKITGTDVRAGSTLTQIQALHNLLAFTGRPLEELLPLLSENPAKAIGVFHRKGSIADGKDADLVLLDEAANIQAVYVGGRPI